MFKTVKENIEEILEITKKCPEKLQDKCFELLLGALLVPQKSTLDEEEKKDGKKGDKKGEFIIPTDVRAFLQQYNIKEEKLKKLFFLEGKDVHATYALKTTKRATGQIQITLLSALESALKNQKFTFSIATVKQKCVDLKTYDTGNFKGTFKKNKDLFKSLQDEENVELTSKGKEELSEVVHKMTT